MFDSSRISFLGAAGLQRLRAAEIAVNGAGGGGSHIVQQLAHLGVQKITVIDPDDLEVSNVNRVVGASYDDVGLPKALILGKRLSPLCGRIVPLIQKCTDEDAVIAQQEADLVFGALDSFTARADCETICRESLTPYIDIGLGICVSESGNILSAGGQVATSLPGRPCLRCMGIVTDARIAADPIEYVVNASPAQQVVSMNGVLASEAVNIGLEILTSFSSRDPLPLYISYDALTHTFGPSAVFDPTTTCPHFKIENAGRAHILPPRLQ